MISVTVTNELKSIVRSFNDELLRSIKVQSSHPVYRLNELLKEAKEESDERIYSYVLFLIDNYESVINADPTMIGSLKKSFDSIIPCDDLKSIRLNSGKSLSSRIVDAMRYNYFRRDHYYDFFKALGFKTCVYCNAQYTIVLDEESRKVLFELDHHLPKSTHPYLSTTPFNLYPCCSNCNKSKGEKYAMFELYSNKKNTNPMSFEIESLSVIRFLLDDSDSYEVKLVSNFDNNTLANNHDELFNINRIYRSHQDVIKEVLVKQKIYSDSYKQTLVDNYPELLGSGLDYIDQILFGNYLSEQDIHKRPLSKLTQDLLKRSYMMEDEKD